MGRVDSITAERRLGRRERLGACEILHSFLPPTMTSGVLDEAAGDERTNQLCRTVPVPLAALLAIQGRTRLHVWPFDSEDEEMDPGTRLPTVPEEQKPPPVLNSLW